MDNERFSRFGMRVYQFILNGYMGISRVTFMLEVTNDVPGLKGECLSGMNGPCAFARFLLQ